MLIVIDEVRVRHVDDLLRVEPIESIRRRCNLIGHNVVDVICSHRATESHELDLNWGRSQYKDVSSLAGSPPIEVPKDVNVFLIDLGCELD